MKRLMVAFIALIFAMQLAPVEAKDSYAGLDSAILAPVKQEKPVRLANHYGDGVLSRRFVGQGRCSQVCPIMRDIARAHCTKSKGNGRCWCDERGRVTTAHIVCR